MALAPKRRKRLGDLLVEVGLITKEQLEEAIALQSERGIRLGQALVELHYLDEQQLLEVLEYQLGIPHINLGDKLIAPEIVDLVPRETALKHKVMPVEKRGDRLVVASADPFNVFAIDEIREATGLNVELLLATERDIEDAINRHYGVQDVAETVIQTLEDEEEPVESEDELRQMGDEAPIVRLANIIISQGVREKASDIHIEPQEKDVRIRYRVDGFLREVMKTPKRTQMALVSRLKILSKLDIAERRVPQDGQIKMTVDGKEVDLRVSTMPTVYGEKVVLRILDKSSFLLDVDKLGFCPENKAKWREAMRRPYGMILVTGPTGSGKTTTLYATLAALNTPERNIVTVEDPVEYTLPGINQVSINKKAGLTFASALRAILRQDPDIVMVGEIRDQETASIAVQAALTGHLVLSTLHTNDAAGTLTRLVEMGVEPFLVASSVIVAEAQRLVRSICPACKESFEVGRDELLEMGLSTPDDVLKGRKKVTLYRGKGCSRCSQTGYKGRMAIQEIMTLNPKIRALIAENANSDTLKAAAIEEGMITLKEDGICKALKGETTLEEVLRVAYTDD
ncbi:MAG: type IV-A pilus assembly ATPase PilB [Firmicutes bacterium]|nr:type IV-A pilus assembly ATPase PilB [Bacillota bacterium]